MKLALDISQIMYEGTGVSRFTRGLVDAILTAGPDHEWIFFFSSLRGSLDPVIGQNIKKRGYKLVGVKLPPAFLSILWNDMHVLNIERFVGKVDWCISSDWTEPPSQAKKATIVHDLSFKRYPETVHPRIKRTQEKRLQRVKKESRLIFADSESTKQDLITYYSIDKNRVVVNYPGINVKNSSKNEIDTVLKKYNLRKDFILSVGKIEPRKNLSRLIEAFDKLETDVELIITGPPGWDSIKSSNKKVRFLGYVADEELYALYASCLFFVYPSVWEGFGYPVVEAMALGAPVATSKTSSLGEIGKDAAFLFDPEIVDEIGHSMQQLIEDGSLRSKLKEKGQARSKEFTWNNYYSKMIKTLEGY